MKFAVLIFLLTGWMINPAAAQKNGSSKEDFLKMAKYLAAGSGQWMTPNPNFDPEAELSSKGFGLWFNLKLKENLLLLTHVVYRADTAHVTGESYWLWHPGEQRIKYYSIHMRGGFTDGETYFSSDKEFTTTEFSYEPNGKIELSKDYNVIISENQHITTTSNFVDGEWQQTGKYPFKKSGEMEHYKVLKYN